MYRDFYLILGKRIRDRRKELKLTQASVCGSYMTRNMLSRIENGSAHPSLDTLFYIADKLEAPAEYFVSRDSSAALYKKIDCISSIRSLFETKQYRRCAELCRSFDIDDGEISLLEAESELKLACDNMMQSKLRSAEVHLERCESAAEKCIYNSERLKATVQFYKNLIVCIRENKYPVSSLFHEKEVILVEEDFMIFVSTISAYKHSESIPESALNSVNSPIYKSFISAELRINKGEYEEAAQYLRDILTSNPGFFTLYFTVRNLELCYKETGDFKNAYEYAKMRLELLEKFND